MIYLSEEKLKEIERKREGGMSYSKLSIQYGMYPQTLKNIIERRQKARESSNKNAYLMNCRNQFYRKKYIIMYDNRTFKNAIELGKAYGISRASIQCRLDKVFLGKTKCLKIGNVKKPVYFFDFEEAAKVKGMEENAE